MKKKGLFFSFLLFIFCSFNLLAENFPQKASKVEDFIPKGWKSIIVKKGDLNKDKIDDVVLLIQKNDPKNFRNAESGYMYAPIENANFNPIIVLVLLKDKDSQYNLIAKNEKGFFPSEGKAHEEVLESIVDEDSITIKNNTLRIYTYFEAIRGMSSTEYVFRYQNNRFELIGLEIKGYGRHSTSGDTEVDNYSINFSTKKLERYRSWGNISSDKVKEEKTEKTININKNYILENMTETTASEILEKYGN